MAVIGPYTRILGTAQDGGFPHVGCRRACCADAWKNPAVRRRISSISIVDPVSEQFWIVDCTPDFPEQLQTLAQESADGKPAGLDGIFLTHAHVGHYTGLFFLGLEALNTKAVPVYAMPRMTDFLQSNHPWRQLVSEGNIELRSLAAGDAVRLNQRISLTPFVVPHRAEFSETVGFRIRGPAQSVIYLPDIDAWDNLQPPVEELLSGADAAYLDGTFFSESELTHRQLADVPHPPIEDSLRRFAGLPESERRKIRFTHFNHTNPVLDPRSAARQQVHAAGMRLAAEGELIELA